MEDYTELFQLYANLPYAKDNPLDRTIENLLDEAQRLNIAVPEGLADYIEEDSWESSIENYDKLKAKNQRMAEVIKLKSSTNKYEQMADAMMDKAAKALAYLDETEMAAKDVVSMVKMAKELQQYQLQLSKETAPKERLEGVAVVSGTNLLDLLEATEELV